MNAYAVMLPEIQAERQLLAIEAASVPHMEPRPRASVINRYTNRARDNTVKARSMVEALTAAGIPIKNVPRRTGQAGTRRKANGG